VQVEMVQEVEVEAIIITVATDHVEVEVELVIRVQLVVPDPHLPEVRVVEVEKVRVVEVEDMSQPVSQENSTQPSVTVVETILQETVLWVRHQILEVKVEVEVQSLHQQILI
jgi:hypothetical protein